MEGGDEELLQLINDDDDDDDEILNLINFGFLEEIDIPLLPIVAACNNEQVEVEVEEVENSNTPSPNSLIDEVEKYLMKDDDDDDDHEVEEEEENFFLSDLLLDVPPSPPPPPPPPIDDDQSVEPTRTRSRRRVSSSSNEVEEVEVDDCSNPESNNVSSDGYCIIEKESSDVSNQELFKDGENDDDDDQITKKRKRQMRNRDAALRSRERKKLYVKDLEIKSRYLESECKRLHHLLQCYAAENQSLHHHLHLQKNNNNKASGASVNNKQESAVLLLESLLLGSLLWLMGIICLFFLPGLLFHRPNPPPADVLVSVGSGNLVEVVSLRAKNRRIGFRRLLKFFRRKRWKATRLKIKEVFPSFADAVTHAVFV